MRKEILAQIIKEKPEAVLVKNKYKVLVGMIKRLYPNNFEKITLTEGQDKENKVRLEQEYIIKNLL